MSDGLDVELAGARLDEFLKDEAVQQAFTLMKQQAYTDFVAAQDDEERRMAQAKAKVLDTLEAALRAVVDVGERARTERERRERAPDTRHFAE